MPLSFGSDSLWNYEIGSKGRFLDGRLTTDLSVYYVSWSDIQTRVFVNGAGFNGNAGKAHILGLEFAVDARPTDQLTFTLAGSLLEAKLDENEPIDPNFPTGFEGKKGDRLPGVPQFTINASAQYDYSISETLDGSVHANLSYTGDSFTEFRAVAPANPAYYDKLHSYALVNLRTTISGEKWDASLYVNNLFDARAELDVLHFLGQETKTTTNRPRTVGVRVGYKF